MKKKTPPRTAGIDPGNPAAALTALNGVTRHLRTAYRDLQGKFEDLNNKLLQANLELKQSLAQKQKISSYLNNILDNLTSGVVAIDLQGRIVLFNSAAAKILGYRAEEVVGKPYAEALGAVLEQDLGLPHFLTNERACYEQEKRFRCHSGREIVVSFSAFPLKESEGGLMGAVEVFSELPRPEETREELMRVKTLAALGEMAAVVAHEIKNPLGGIRGFAELLDRDTDEADPRKRSVRKIIEGVEALSAIVARLLDYTRPVELSPRKIEMAEFVDETVNFFQMDSSQLETGIRMIRGYPEEKLYCELDAQQFRQILLNILHNAVQAMPDGGEIRIELSRETAPRGLPEKPDRGSVILKVSDTGIGMSEETRKKIFTPFFTTKQGGTGLGLSTVKKIVEAHGGEIQLQSEPGKGTTVVMGLPVAP
jgi:PAS domain S-box-containing protein